MYVNNSFKYFKIIEVVSMSILVSLETENTATICNFETVSSFVTSQYLMRGQM